MGRAANRAELDAVLQGIFDAGDEVIIEPVLAGREVTCGILVKRPCRPY